MSESGQVDPDELERRKYSSSGSGSAMERVSLRMPDHLIETVDQAAEYGDYENRSEVIRSAVREHLLTTDGGLDENDVVTEMMKDARRQTAALEDLSEQLRVQNAVLLELVSTQQRANRIAMQRDPDDWPSPKSRATSVEDNVLHLAENVDVDTALRFAND